MEIQIVFKFCYYEHSCYEYSYTCFFLYMCKSFSCVYTQVIANCGSYKCLVLRENVNCFLLWLYQFTFPWATYEFLLTLSTLVISKIINFCQSNGFESISLYLIYLITIQVENAFTCLLAIVVSSSLKFLLILLTCWSSLYIIKFNLYWVYVMIIFFWFMSYFSLSLWSFWWTELLTFNTNLSVFSFNWIFLIYF